MLEAPLNRRERLAAAVAKRLPYQLAACPERVLINTICVLVGLSALINPPRFWSASVGHAWAVVMLAGGMCALAGYWNEHASTLRRRRRARSLARVGYLALLGGSFFYGAAAILLFGWRAVPVACAFFAIGVAKAVRLVLSTAARAAVLRRGEPSEGSS